MIPLRSQRNSQKLLDTIGSVLVGTTKGLDAYTCGDSFRENLLSIKREIYQIYDHQSFVERMVIGRFGSGKSHFMECVYRFLQEDLSGSKTNPHCVISRVDLTKLHSPEDLEYRILAGLEFPDGRGYDQVLIEAYRTIKQQFNHKTPMLSEKMNKAAWAELLLKLLGYAALGHFSAINAGEAVLSSRVIGDMLNLPKRWLNKASAGPSLKDASPEHRQFIEAYLQLISRPGKALSQFEKPARKLSQDGRLCDLVFRILKMAGVKMIVLLVDELESLNRQDQYFLRSVLERFRGFRDDFNKVLNKEESYPSAALVVSSTDLFFKEELRHHSTALFSRWNKVPHFYLTPLSDADIDNLIYDLRKLYFYAGISLKPVKDTPEGSEVALLRNRVKEKLGEEGFTTRNLVTSLKKEIERNWVR